MRVFRKLREALFANSKYKRYLGYALGEIILVIIGILIALSIGSKKEREIHENQVKRILVEIQRDIVQNIKETENKIEIFVIRDHMKNMLFNDKLTRNKLRIAEQTFDFLPYIFFLHGDQTTRNVGYEQFVKKLEGLSSKYTDLVKELSLLNGHYDAAFNQEPKRYNQLVTAMRHHAYDNTEWFANDQFSGKLSDEAIEFLISDKTYKDYVMKQSDISVSEIKAILDYREQAIMVFEMISDLLESASLSMPNSIRKSTLSSEEDPEKFIGSYKFVQGSDLRCNLIKIIQDAESLFVVCGNDTTKLSYGLSNEAVFGYNESYLRLYVFDKHTTLLPIIKSVIGSPNDSIKIEDQLTIIDGIRDASIWKRSNKE